MIKQMMALDWRAMKYYQIRGLLLPVVGFATGVVYSPILVIPFLTLFAMSFSINPFAVEEKGELNNLYLTLPIQKKQIVLGRYALSFTMMLLAIVMGIPLMVISNTISFSKYFIGVKGVIAIIALSLLMYSILNLSTFPTLFRLGYQKGKMWGFYIPVILFSVIIVGYYIATMMIGNETHIIDSIAYVADNLLLVSGIVIILAISLLFVSCVISIKLYSTRDF